MTTTTSQLSLIPKSPNLSATLISADGAGSISDIPGGEDIFQKVVALDRIYNRVLEGHINNDSRLMKLETGVTKLETGLAKLESSMDNRFHALNLDLDRMIFAAMEKFTQTSSTTLETRTAEEIGAPSRYVPPNQRQVQIPSPEQNSGTRKFVVAGHHESHCENLLRNVELPIFAGKSVYSWLARVERYFRLHVSTDREKLKLISFSLAADALDWFNHEMLEDPFVHWQNFVDRILARFGQTHSHGHRNDQLGHLQNVEIPLFEGPRVYWWLVRIERYFRLQGITDQEKLELVSVSLIGDALSWYNHKFIKQPFHHWCHFVDSILLRFGHMPSLNLSHTASGHKQNEIVVDYVREMKDLSLKKKIDSVEEHESPEAKTSKVSHEGILQPSKVTNSMFEKVKEVGQRVGLEESLGETKELSEELTKVYETKSSEVSEEITAKESIHKVKSSCLSYLMEKKVNEVVLENQIILASLSPKEQESRQNTTELILRNTFKDNDTMDVNTKVTYSKLNVLKIDGIQELDTLTSAMGCLIDSATVPILVVDSDGLVNGWRTKNAELNGFSIDDGIEKHLLPLVDDSLVEIVQRMLENALDRMQYGNYKQTSFFCVCDGTESVVFIFVETATVEKLPKTWKFKFKQARRSINQLEKLMVDNPRFVKKIATEKQLHEFEEKLIVREQMKMGRIWFNELEFVESMKFDKGYIFQCFITKVSGLNLDQFNLIMLGTCKHMSVYIDDTIVLYVSDETNSLGERDQVLFMVELRTFSYAKATLQATLASYVGVALLDTSTELKMLTTPHRPHHALRQGGVTIWESMEEQWWFSASQHIFKTNFVFGSLPRPPDSYSEAMFLSECNGWKMQSTVQSLMEKANVVIGEAERQRLKKELEMELHTIKQQREHAKSTDGDMRNVFDESHMDLEKAKNHREHQFLIWEQPSHPRQQAQVYKQWQWRYPKDWMFKFKCRESLGASFS